MVKEIGEESFSAALVAAVRSSEYFPVIAKIRQCASLSAEQQKAAGADAAWQYVIAYNSKGYACDWAKNVPALPVRIEYAARAVGGIHAINNADPKSVPFMRRDFCTAWEQYQESSAALGELLLASPLEFPPDRLLATDKREAEETAKATSKEIVTHAMPHLKVRELTDAEFEDRKEILRQQAEKLKSV